MNESETIRADVGLKFNLPNGKHVWAKPVSFAEARKIMALIHAFDASPDYERTLQAAIDRFCAATGITDDEVLALCPTMTLGDLVLEIQRFFFYRTPTKPTPTNNTTAAAATASSGA